MPGIFSGCREAGTNENGRVSITDDLGRKIKVPQELKNGLIGLSPAVTEILAEVVPKEFLLARTKACDFPEWVLDKPELESYPLDIESIISLEPDLLFSEKGIVPEDVLKKLQGFGIETYVFDYQSPMDVARATKILGEIFPQLSSQSEEANTRFLEGINAEKVEEKSGLTAIGIIWTDPIYVFGHNTILTGELNWIGIENAIDSVFSVPYPEISREYLLKKDPDMIFGMTHLEFHENLVIRFPELSNLKAYRDSSIFDVNHDLFTRPSPRIPLLMKELKALAYE